MIRVCDLEGAQSAGSHAVADAVRSELFAVAADAVDFVVGRVVQIGRIQRAVTLGAVEAAAMPHLFPICIRIEQFESTINRNHRSVIDRFTKHIANDSPCSCRSSARLRKLRNRIGDILHLRPLSVQVSIRY